MIRLVATLSLNDVVSISRYIVKSDVSRDISHKETKIRKHVKSRACKIWIFKYDKSWKTCVSESWANIKVYQLFNKTTQLYPLNKTNTGSSRYQAIGFACNALPRTCENIHIHSLLCIPEIH